MLKCLKLLHVYNSFSQLENNTNIGEATKPAKQKSTNHKKLNERENLANQLRTVTSKI